MIIISLGSNVTSRWGNADTTILMAFRELECRGIRVLARSCLYETKPHGLVNQPNFINAAVLISTSLPPAALLSRLKRIEVRAGRRSLKRWGPRPLDMDIIDYNGQILNWSNYGTQGIKCSRSRLTLPHPEAARRPFVLQPISDIAPTWLHPVYGLNASQLLRRLHPGTMGQIMETPG